MRPIWKSKGFVPLAVLGAIAILTYLFPRAAGLTFAPIFEAARPDLVADSGPTSERYRLVEGSVYDGDTLRVTDGRQEIKIRLCGIDAPAFSVRGSVGSCRGLSGSHLLCLIWAWAVRGLSAGGGFWRLSYLVRRSAWRASSVPSS